MKKVPCTVCTILCNPAEGRTTCDDKCEKYAVKYSYKVQERKPHASIEKVCENCGTDFIAKFPTARLCSEACKRVNHNIAQMKYWQKNQIT